MKKTYLNKISKKRQEQYKIYFPLIDKLRELCGNKSELSGKEPDWESNWFVEPHHIDGRTGNKYLDPFEIIMLRRDEHDIEGGKRKGERMGANYLRALVYEIRIKQGFAPLKKNGKGG